MTGIGYDICKTQQRIYEYTASKGYDMVSFSDAYLKSDFCKRAMDSAYSRFQLETPLECAGMDRICVSTDLYGNRYFERKIGAIDFLSHNGTILSRNAHD